MPLASGPPRGLEFVLDSMRTLLPILLLAALQAPPAFAGKVLVDPYNQVVETSHIRMTFDWDRPEYAWNVVYKDWNPYIDIAGDEGHAREYWGQTLRGVDSTGFVLNGELETHSWEVLDTVGTLAKIRIRSESPGQPPVTTTYLFEADQPWMVVERTVHFSQHPDSAACQLYAARVDFVNTYRALRWRDVTGAYIQRGYCFGGCETPSWDGRWLEHISITNDAGFSVAQIYPPSMAPGTTIVRGFGPESFAGWVAPLLPAGPHDTDVTTRVLIAFSTHPADTTALDSLWERFQSFSMTLDAPPTAGRPPLRLDVSPNPVAGTARLAWTLPAAGRVSLELLDVGGRRVAKLLDAEAAAGPQSLAWDGRDATGRAAPPGVYLARLATPGGVATTRVVRIR
jgi:hypothetical protein